MQTRSSRSGTTVLRGKRFYIHVINFVEREQGEGSCRTATWQIRGCSCSECLLQCVHSRRMGFDGESCVPTWLTTPVSKHTHANRPGRLATGEHNFLVIFFCNMRATQGANSYYIWVPTRTYDNCSQKSRNSQCSAANCSDFLCETCATERRRSGILPHLAASFASDCGGWDCLVHNLFFYLFLHACLPAWLVCTDHPTPRPPFQLPESN